MEFFNKIGNVFSNLWNFLCNSWIGAVIGLVVGLILCGILSLTIFKAGGLPKIVTTIIILLFALLGGYIQYHFTFESVKAESEEIVLIPGTDIADPDDILESTANEGMAKPDIEKAEADPNCPTAEDKNFDISMVEYSDIVIFYYTEQIDEQRLLHNIAFEKTENGLIFTGAFNVQIDRELKLKFGGWFPFIHVVDKYTFVDLNTNENWFTPLEKPINTKTFNYYLMCYEPTDYGINAGKATGKSGDIFAMFKYGFNSGNLYSHKLIMNKAQIGCFEIYNDYFQQLGEMGIKSTEETIKQDLGTFYNAVYTATTNIGISSKVNVTSLVGDVKDGVVYKSNRYLNVEYYNYSDKNALAGNKKKPAKEYIEDMQPATDSEMKIEFVSTDNEGISEFDFSKGPVTIRLFNSKNEFVYVLDEYSDLSCLTMTVPFGKYYCHISSEYICVLPTSSVVIINTPEFILRLNYVYKVNHVFTGINFQPGSDEFKTRLDLSSNPVIIKLTNTEDSSIVYTYEIDSSSYMGGQWSEYIQIGTYTFEVESEVLKIEHPEQIEIKPYGFYEFYYSY